MTTRRNFMMGLFTVAAAAAVPIDALTALVGKPTRLAPAMRARYSDLVGQALRERSAQLADCVLANNALLQRLQATGKAATMIAFEDGEITSREVDL